MKNIIKRNKVLFLAVAIVLAGGICLTLVLISQTQVAMAAEKIETAEAEAAESVAAEEPNPTSEPTAVPQPTTANTTLSAEALRIVVGRKEMRRENVIPRLDNSGGSEADTWKMIEPDNFEALKQKAQEKAADYAKTFFGYDMADGAADFCYYTDTSGHRGDFIKATTTDEAIICTLAADTLDLINIDYYFIPDGEQAEKDIDYSEVPDNDREIADKIAAVFNTTVAEVTHTSGGGGSGIWRLNYTLKMANGKLAKFAVMNGALYAVAIYPSEACLMEGVYFEADVQSDASIVKLASEQSFAQGEPGAGDMTQEQAQSIFQTFLKQANGDGQYDQPKMTFFIDNSETRENYWHMESKKLTMDIASKSKWIISLTCDDLWNSGLDLTKIDEIGMGGREYENYVASIMSSIYGEGFLYAGVNAVYDDHFCTEDAWMADGSIYEFEFADGKLREVMYFADEDCFRSYLIGWKADHEYINTATGETFIPSY